MVLRRVSGLLVLSLCSGQSTSPTTSPSPAPTPCSAPPGYFCSGGFTNICPIGAYCAGGSALNVSCYPVTACTVSGLSAQPPCGYWDVSLVAGTGVLGSLNGPVATATFGSPCGIAFSPAGSGAAMYITDSNTYRLRLLRGGNVTTLAGSGILGAVDGFGTSASFGSIQSPDVDSSGNIFIPDGLHRIRKVSPNGTVTTFSGSVLGYLDGIGTSALLYWPQGVAFDSLGNLFVADGGNHRIRRISSSAVATTIAGSGAATFADGVGTLSAFNWPRDVALDSSSNIYVADGGNGRIRLITPSGIVTTLSSGVNNPTGITVTPGGISFVSEWSGNKILQVMPTGATTIIAGTGAASYSNGIGTTAAFNVPGSIQFDSTGILYVADTTGQRIRRLICVPCPASYYCMSSAPILCPAGFYCPFGSTSAIPCPRGTFASTGAANCTICPAGTFSFATGTKSCQQCPGGHYCPAGTSSWARLNCGSGNYCPDGSGAPTPCPYQVPPTDGWGALQVQGPAFLVETANCLNHCFWNFTSGDGAMSKC